IVVVTPSTFEPGEDGGPNWVEKEIACFAEDRQGNIIAVRAAGALNGPLPGNLRVRFPFIHIVDLRAFYPKPSLLARLSFRQHNALAPLVAELQDIGITQIPKLKRHGVLRFMAGVSVSIAIVAALAASFLGLSRSLDQARSQSRANEKAAQR